VAYPNINPVQEMVDLMGAVRSYQLNASAITASKQMIQQSIELLK
jgi:flagellar basal-body rod protein FlgC